MLTEVNIKDFPKLEGIVNRNIASCKCDTRTSYEYIKATVTLFALAENIGVWTDNLEDPHALIIVTKGKFGVLNETFAFVNTIYVDEDQRAIDILQKMVDTATLWAKNNSCNTVQVSSWVYRGCKNVRGLWDKFGFEPQETIYVKEV